MSGVMFTGLLQQLGGNGKGSKVSGVRHSSSSNHFVTREGFLIIARGRAGDLVKDIKEGTPVSVSIEWTDPGFRDWRTSFRPARCF